MIKLKSILNESKHSGKTFISVDIQPEYQSSISFPISRFCDFLNENEDGFGKLVFLYNGKDTLDMISEYDYKMWLIENGLDENILDHSYFYDKGYAFFRYCMDSSIDETAVANFVRFMYQNDIRDSRDMDRPMWAKYLREYRRTDKKEVYELLKHSDDCVNIPDLMDYIRRFNNIILTGGAVDQCLKEVEIALQALKIPYGVEHKFTY